MLELLQAVVAFKDPSDLQWIFYVGILISFAMGFATGANDVANTFGTSVGSGALTLRKAMIIAGICEFLGATTLGSLVAKTIAGGIADPTCFVGSEGLLMAGMLSALSAAAIWLIVASLMGLPVSTTHSIVGAIVGMALATKGTQCVNWGMNGMGAIVLSWVTSPILAGLVAFGIYWLIMRYVIHGRFPVENAFRGLPYFAAITSAVLVFLIAKSVTSKLFSVWILLVLVSVFAAVVFGVVRIFFVPWMRRQPTLFQDVAPIGTASFRPVKTESKEIAEENMLEMNRIEAEDIEETDTTEVSLRDIGSDDEQTQEDPSALASTQDGLIDDIDDGESLEHARERHKARNLFFHIQLLTASLGAFAHGANDTANAIGPFAAIFFLWQHADYVKVEIPLWMITLGGVSIVVGLSVLGSRVIQTMGTDMTHIDYVNGFTTELCSGLTVVLASALSVPVSSTHCQVGAIVGVGLVPDKDKKHLENAGVNWKLFAKIFASWLITVPFSGLVSALLAWLLSYAVSMPRGALTPSLAPVSLVPTS